MFNLGWDNIYTQLKKIPLLKKQHSKKPHFIMQSFKYVQSKQKSIMNVSCPWPSFHSDQHAVVFISPCLHPLSSHCLIIIINTFAGFFFFLEFGNIYTYWKSKF